MLGFLFRAEDCGGNLLAGPHCTFSNFSDKALIGCKRVRDDIRKYTGLNKHRSLSRLGVERTLLVLLLTKSCAKLDDHEMPVHILQECFRLFLQCRDRRCQHAGFEQLQERLLLVVTLGHGFLALRDREQISSGVVLLVAGVVGLKSDESCEIIRQLVLSNEQFDV